MQTTTNYGYKVYQSGDLFNPLTTNNVNVEAIDSDLKAVSDRAIGRATELVSQGVHAITLLDADCTTFKFTATGNYAHGETFTLNGVAISGYMPDGTTLSTDAYKTGAVVIASRNADDSALTFYLSSVGGVAPDSAKLGGELPAYYATKSYADGIKTTADNASTLIQKKALVNTYYDTSSHKLYVINSDGTVGGEIVMSKELDFDNAIDLGGSSTPISYTTQSVGALVLASGKGATGSSYPLITIDGVPVFRFNDTNGGVLSYMVGDVPSGSEILASAKINWSSGGRASFVPYK